MTQLETLETLWDDWDKWSAAVDGHKLCRRDGQGRRDTGVALVWFSWFFFGFCFLGFWGGFFVLFFGVGSLCFYCLEPNGRTRG